MADEYLDVVAFIAGRDGKKRPQRCGRAKVVGSDKVQIYLDCVPVGAWDGSLVCEPRRQQGGGFSAPPREAPTGRGRNDDDIPF